MEQGAPHTRAVYMVMGLVREVAGCENWYKCSSSLNFFPAVSHHPNATLRLSFFISYDIQRNCISKLTAYLRVSLNHQALYAASQEESRLIPRHKISSIIRSMRLQWEF